jgi:thioredoxin-related protein
MKAIILSLIFVVSFSFAQTKKVHFETTTFTGIKAKAKKENKLIFIDAYTSWCGPCKWMAANVFTNDTVADYFNAKFINAKFDMEKGEGVDIAKLYEVHCYPNLLFIDGDGNIVHRWAGGMNQKDFLKLAETASDQKKRLLYFEEEYPKKKSDPEFLLNYLRILDNASCEKERFTKRDNLLNEYFALQTEEMLTNMANWIAIRDFTYDYRSREFSYLLKNAATYKKLYPEDSVNSKIKNVLLNGGRLFFGKRILTEANELAYINEIKKLNSPEAEPALFWLSLDCAKESEKWQDYMVFVIESGDKYLRSSEEKEIVSKIIYENVEDKVALQKAEQMMKDAAEKDPGWLVYETYANVLYKLNKKNDAKSMALKSLDAAKRTGAKEKNYESVTYLLEKIEQLPTQ